MDLGKMLFSAEGRIRRRDYWLVSLAVGLALCVIIGLAAVITRGFGTPENPQADPVFMLIYFAVFVIGTWISVCLQIKRWHDRDKSWPWIFIALVPLIGGFWVLIECGFLDGTQGPNRFGPSPKGIAGKDSVAKAFE